MRVIFWQNILSFYQAPHIRSLAEQGYDVTWVAEETLSRDRQAQGWSAPDAGGARIVVDPTEAAITDLIAQDPAGSVHIFSGIGAFPLVDRAFHQCLTTSARMGLLVENRDNRGWKGLIRLAKHRRDYSRYGKRIDFILAMGYTGANGGQYWYRRCGYPAEKIFPYGYFPETPSALPEMEPGTNERGAEEPFRLTYVGQYVERKGVDVLLHALGRLKDLSWTFTAVGNGPCQDAWMRLAEALGIKERVSFLPVMPNAEALALVAKSDLFVLPSRFDGWGVVVNEALLRGVPTVCSDRCGAADLLGEEWRGETFPCGSVEGLRDVLQRRIGHGRRTPEQAERIRAWANCLSGESAANYLRAVLDAALRHQNRPAAPWLSS